MPRTRKKRSGDSWKIKLDLLSLGIPWEYIHSGISLEELSEALDYKKKQVEHLNGRLLSTFDYYILSTKSGKDDNDTRIMRLQSEVLKDILTGNSNNSLTKQNEISRINQELEKVGIKPVK